jgi:hypothetical protein
MYTVPLGRSICGGVAKFISRSANFHDGALYTPKIEIVTKIVGKASSQPIREPRFYTVERQYSRFEAGVVARLLLIGADHRLAQRMRPR